MNGVQIFQKPFLAVERLASFELSLTLGKNARDYGRWDWPLSDPFGPLADSIDRGGALIESG